jgi:hypothetical protein
MACKRMFQGGVLSFALLLTMSFVPSGTAQARDRDDSCRARIHKQAEKLELAVRRHGERSRQAAKARARLHEVREKCDDRHDRDHGNRWR